MTTFRDGTKEEGKYKYNVLITSQKKKHLFLIRSAKFRERIDAAVSSSQRASKYALQKADIAVSRTATARSKAEMADSVGDHARVDSEIAVATAREFAPDFKPSVLDRFERLRVRERYRSLNDPPMPSAHIKPQLTTQISSNTTLNHLPSDNRTQASTDSTPQKQASIPNQASLRRQSMLQKQASIDVPPGGLGPLPQHTLHYTPPIGTQPPFKTYQPDMYNSYGNQDPSNQSNYNSPNQNYFSQPNTQQFNNSNYMGNVPQMQSKYPANSMMQSQYGSAMGSVSGGINETQMQYTQPPFSMQQQSAYQNYSLSNQVDGSQDYQSGAVSSQYDQTDTNTQDHGPGPSNLRRNSRQVNETSRPHIGSSFSQSSIDHYDHYKRPPSRDSSVDRYARAASRLSGSRQPSIDRSILPSANNLNSLQNQSDTGTLDRNVRAGSAFRNMGTIAMTPAVPHQSSGESFRINFFEVF